MQIHAVVVVIRSMFIPVTEKANKYIINILYLSKII